MIIVSFVYIIYVSIKTIISLDIFLFSKYYVHMICTLLTHTFPHIYLFNQQKNRQIKDSPRSGQSVGPPPNITGSSRFDFVAYFDNEHGEQNLVVWDFDKSTHPYLLDGDWTWSKAIPFVGKESFELTELVKGDTVVQLKNSHLIGIDKMMILKDLLLVGKKKYEGWKENGGVTNQFSGCTIPYHDVSRRKGCILSVPNHAARVPGLKDDIGLPPCFDAPSRLPEPDSWCTTEMGDKISIVLKSPVYVWTQHLLLRFIARHWPNCHVLGYDN